LSFESWLEATTYSRKKKIQLTAINRAYACGRKVFDANTLIVKCFIKNEAYPTYKYPRAILARTDDFKVLMGPVFKVIENHLFSMKSESGYNYFIKKIPVPKRAAYILDVLGLEVGYSDLNTKDQYLRRYVVTDYSSFESSFTKDIMEACEFQFYKKCLIDLPDGRGYLDMMGHLMKINRCFFNEWKFTIRARRMSGEMNTSLGNGFSNLMLTKFVLSSIGARDVRLLVEGDDCIVTYIGPMFTPELVNSLGFKLKFVFIRSPNYASFCGQIFDLAHLVVVCDPIKVILNFAWTNMKYFKSSNAIKMGLVRSKALSLIYQYSGCPIVQSFARAMLRCSEGFQPVVDQTIDAYHRWLYIESLNIIPNYKPVQMSTRQIVEEVYGISIVHQQTIEKYFDTFQFGPIRSNIIAQYCHDDQIHYFENYVFFANCL